VAFENINILYIKGTEDSPETEWTEMKVSRKFNDSQIYEMGSAKWMGWVKLTYWLRCVLTASIHPKNANLIVQTIA